MYLSLAVLDPGDEIVCGWPSFPSYVLDAVKMGAVPVRVPLDEDTYDLDALLAAITERTKIVYVANPNNPTGTMVSRAQLDAYFERVPEHVLTVLDEAYFEYVDAEDYPDGIDEYFLGGRRVFCLRTFSKMFGLAGLRVGYGIGSPEVVGAIRKVRNAFDLNEMSQAAALASLGNDEEIARRRAITAEGRAQLLEICAELPVRVATARRRELRLRGHGSRCRAALRLAPPRGRHRPAAGAVRRADRDPGHRWDGRGERLLRRGVRARARAGRPSASGPRIAAVAGARVARLRTALLRRARLRRRNVARVHRARRGRDQHDRRRRALGERAPHRRVPAARSRRAPHRRRSSTAFKRRRILVAADLVRAIVFVAAPVRADRALDRRARLPRGRRDELLPARRLRRTTEPRPRPTGFRGRTRFSSRPTTSPGRSARSSAEPSWRLGRPRRSRTRSTRSASSSRPIFLLRINSSLEEEDARAEPRPFPRPRRRHRLVVHERPLFTVLIAWSLVMLANAGVERRRDLPGEGGLRCRGLRLRLPRRRRRDGARDRESRRGRGDRAARHPRAVRRVDRDHGRRACSQPLCRRTSGSRPGSPSAPESGTVRRSSATPCSCSAARPMRCAAAPSPSS